MDKKDLETIFEKSAIGITLVDKNGKFIDVNDKACEILKYSEPELLNKKFQDITHPEDLELDIFLANEVINGKRNGYSLVKRYITKTGKVVSTTLIVMAKRDEGGNFVHFISQIVPLVNGEVGVKYSRTDMGQPFSYKENTVSRFIEKNWKFLIILAAAANNAIADLVYKILEISP